MFQPAALALFPRTEQYGSHGGRYSCADGGHVRFNELHGVINPEAGVDASPRGIDINLYVFGGIRTGQEQQLGLDDIGYLVADRGPQENDAVHHQPGEHVHGNGIELPFLDDIRGHSHRVHALQQGLYIQAVHSLVLDGEFFEFLGVVHVVALTYLLQKKGAETDSSGTVKILNLRIPEARSWNLGPPRNGYP